MARRALPFPHFMTSTDPLAPIRVAVADDHALVRAAVKRLVSSFADMHFVGQAGNAEEALMLVRSAEVHVLLVDVDLRGRSGLEILPLLRVAAPRTKLVVISALPAEAQGDRALRAGAYAYLEKPVYPHLLVRTIRAAAAMPFAASNDDVFRGRG